MKLGPRTTEVLDKAVEESESGRRIWASEFGDQSSYWDSVDGSHFGLDGEPISMRIWGVIIESGAKVLRQEYVTRGERRSARAWADGSWISTVFIGLDHNWARLGHAPPGADRRPWIYESMAFRIERPRWNDVTLEVDMGGGACLRYATWEEAIAGHELLVAQIRAHGLALYEQRP